eukprot:m.33515 g.33515  ORF g.33515 m.33515 type:complete len:333 (+) comp15254_c0_seq1:2-1000(+)
MNWTIVYDDSLTWASAALQPLSWGTLYNELDPLATGFAIFFLFGLYSYVASIFSGDYSQVDRLWSITPFIFGWHFAIQGLKRLEGEHANDTQTRLVGMAVLTTVWGIRLTFNFARRGGYDGMEDYRWEEIRKRISPFQFQVMNATFIAFYQHFLLLIIVAPAYLVYLHPCPLTIWDNVIAFVFCTLVFFEWKSDQDQWDFHAIKDAAKAGDVRAQRIADVQRGFLSNGMFRYSRHPNFFCEQSIWWTFACFGWLAAQQADEGTQLTSILPAFAGAFLLSLLFQGSTAFTEELTLRKYPMYALYQQRVSRLIPNIFVSKPVFADHEIPGVKSE